tara:strand:+ start:2904 stop:3092 length:189 start_codon:yes stop_codon:yes gene_type:complete
MAEQSDAPKPLTIDDVHLMILGDQNKLDLFKVVNNLINENNNLKAKVEQLEEELNKLKATKQ